MPDSTGPRGPVLLQDHHLREKITHFDHERIPERVVHARGSTEAAADPRVLLTLAGAYVLAAAVGLLGQHRVWDRFPVSAQA